MKKTIILFFVSFAFFLIFPKFARPALAVKYSLVAPSGSLTRGQNYKFTINVDTQDATITTGEIGLTYDTTYLQYVSTTPGAAMTSVSTSQSGTNQLILDGTNSSGFNGSGVFAYVEFKLIATAAGSTTLCALWVPSGTPTPTPTSGPTATAAPNVTALPTSGATGKGMIATSLGLVLITLFAVFYYLDKQIAFKRPKKK